MEQIVYYTESAKEEIPQSRKAMQKLVKECEEAFKLTGSIPRKTRKALAEETSDSEEDDASHEPVDMPLAKSAKRRDMTNMRS